MRWKAEANEPREYTCCGCLHVRTGTICLGMTMVVLQVMGLAFMAMDPELVRQGQVVPQATDDNVLGLDYTYEDKFVALLPFIGAFSVTVLLIVGVIKGKAGYLLPFFFVQVFNFCVSCLVIVAYFSCLPNVKKWFAVQQNFPNKEELLQMDDDWLMLSTVIFFVLVLSIQAYVLGVVWSCYKYLTACSRGAYAPVRAYDAAGGEDSEMLLPPKYEDAIRMSEEQPPPPPYYPAE